MNIEDEIFKRTQIDLEKLISYGFIKENNMYKYSKNFMDNFRVDIEIDEKGKVFGKVYDLNMDEEYRNFRIETQAGKFVSLVREEYQNILKDIVQNCCNKLYFATEQANRITMKIRNMYGDEPEFIWDKFPENGIFRNPSNFST